MNKKAKILVVEDEGIVALDIQSRLRQLGYVVPKFVMSGEEAVTAVSQVKPDLMLMDIKLKGVMDGIDTAVKIRQQHNIPVIFLTAFADEPTLERAKAAEPYGYLLKPFQERELLATIRMALYRQQIEQQLKESEARFRSIIDNALDGFVLVNQDGLVVAWNPAMTMISGLSEEEVLKRPFWEVHYQMMCDDQKNIQIKNVIEAATKAALKTGLIPPEELNKEGRFQRPDGTKRYLQSRAFTITHNDEVMLATIMRDVTLEKALEAQLNHKQKMESLGILAGGIAHDFNNLLAVMLSQSSLALAQLPPDIQARGHLEKAVQAMQSASDITQKLLAFSGRGQFLGDPVDVDAFLGKWWDVLVTAVPSHITITHTTPTEALPPIKIDGEQVVQALLHIIENAVEAIGEAHGRITISTNFIPTSHLPAPETDHTLPSQGFVRLAVHDNGPGIPDAIKSKVFEPFFSTKELGRGLGLSVVEGVLKGHKGWAQALSEPGMGTVIALYFPVVETPVQETAVSPETSPAQTRTNCAVLVIDDEEGICEAVTDILDLQDIPVFTARNGQKGVELYRQKQHEIGLVLLDYSMPDMNGEAVFNALRRINPQVKVLLSTGYNEQHLSDGFDLSALAGILRKPYDFATLVTAVTTHLHNSVLKKE
ncbi:MAG: hypothetical protein Kow0080_27580 [Candidatus Promineifilaceae bacterium]